MEKFLKILCWSALSGSITASCANGIPAQPTIGVERNSEGIASSSPEAKTATPTAPSPSPSSNWKSMLPKPDQALRQSYEQDKFLQGWLSTQDVWIGYATGDELLNRGFYLNAGYKFDGVRAQPKDQAQGSCSALGFGNPAPHICGRGAFGSPDWGIQSDEAIAAFKAIANSGTAQKEPKAESVASSTNPAFNAEIFDPPSNCRADAGKSYSVVTAFPRGVVAIDTSAPKVNEGKWYRELYKNCWIHESQLRWLANVTTDQGGGEVYDERPQTAPEQPAQPTSSGSSGSGRCNSPDDVDVRGHRCGARASSVRRGGR